MLGPSSGVGRADEGVGWNSPGRVQVANLFQGEVWLAIEKFGRTRSGAHDGDR